MKNQSELLQNQDPATVSGFGDEWQRFDQSELSQQELQEQFQRYFHIFPWASLPTGAAGFDAGCGSGRWARLVAPRVDKLHCLDASEAALEVAKRNLGEFKNCEFHHTTIDDAPIPAGSMDFGYSLGVLHHIPDTEQALQSLVRLLKPDAPFLIYIYYAFDNRPFWFRWLWKISNAIRLVISRLPYGGRYIASQIIAISIYFPFARIARLLDSLGFNVESFPLSAYRNNSFYTMRTDALDRFGTRLEKRFTRKQIESMMLDAGLEHIKFSESVPYWCAVGHKRK
jgi:ubiquinone/menaquinone biosynthesis C-methylase UbiE